MPEPRRRGLRRLRGVAPGSTGAPPAHAAVRTAKLAALPVGYAARRAAGMRRRALGRTAHEVELDIQTRTAQHMFEVLGELKGCAAKLGQLLAIYELALPPELGTPYRTALGRLQDSAPALLPRAVSAAMADSLGEHWRSRFLEFDLRACAAASIGQVHRGVWRDRRPVAVKLMYPGVRESVRTDLDQLRRLAPLAAVLLPGADMRALTEAFADCVLEELDYPKEAATQRIFAAAFADDPDFAVPAIVHQHGDVIVSEWLDGIALPRILASGAPAERSRVGLLVLRFLLSGFARTGLLYTDPHPGNFRVLRDGRLGVVDFGACTPFPAEFPALVGDLADAAYNGTPADLEAALRRHGFVAAGTEFDREAFAAMIDPVRELLLPHTARMSTAWLREQVRRCTEPRLTNVCRQLTSPPEYAPIGRTILAAIGLLCQLGTQGPLRDELLTPLPELAAALERFHLGQDPLPRDPVTGASRSATPAPRTVCARCTSIS
ncbi:AarF/ABC1/UbiB kinase family protein [Nocardia sp. 2]|uniref:AarF/ABC1/UbiB kinase family protein n=1 Tax=Nocardia acididurans TaxID=2802282 RepID=A0ABS1M226_9NOCA|nr:AarF/ABC1/UbiB kinase family protein [Nocardia acididurans]MBL1073869.1 AarF/ABC1/UbiB kinase family protein [Nocardia acididurans]